MSEKMWGGRFSLPTDKFVEEFNASVHFDNRFYKYDIKGSIAHAKMLAKQEIISTEDRDSIIKGLNQVLQEIETGKLEWKTEDEDIHMAVEKRLTELVGDAGKRLHTARSRNDQVAVDFRMYLKAEIIEIQALIAELLNTLMKKAEAEHEVMMPGFTHLQTAQPILFAHWAMAYFQMIKRDFSRFADCLERMDFCPLGAGALAGTTFNIDRHFTAAELGFKAPTENSLDSVSDRDFALEFLAACSICQMHLSRFSEELIIYSASEFSFIELSDDFCTGSSIMPQKKNPDMPELIRGKTGRVYGSLISLLTTMKGLPLAYNKDMQEDKEPVFDAVDTIKASLKIFSPMVEKMTLRKDKMEKSAGNGYSTATDLADYLVRKGVPFRQSHHIVGSAVAYAIEKGVDLSELSMDEFARFTDVITDDIYQYITVRASVNSRVAYGGTAESSVKEQIKSAKKFLNEIY
ncbi:argininosuccinate lyase [Denitrovibrio acetiphilus DSM 12809]|uniref:Argininosuccinate lyase n=1 Tax=Denitrovibrio acetiphilus (strain DSM 12809 / NBRC 114555 / N2460) TaxID=522772 RepID=D4H6G2_DENA2|nr:argininosuccinate lyase [Denitrovibrio acetiphilus]ADD69636.1 argininosuccinate lyase [Denitrovibrio acetiphilus DSM 12809]